MAGFNWNGDSIEALKKYVEAGASAAQIAGLLSSDFSQTISRNAVIGKIHRLGFILKRPGPGSARDKVVKKIRHVRQSKYNIPFGASPKISAVRPKISKPVGNEPTQGTLSLNDLNSTTCRWPFGEEPPFIYCGATALKDRPYCIHHMIRGTDTSRPFKRRIWK